MDTDREQSESRQTAKASQKQRITLSSIGDAVITTDTKGRVTLLNPVAEFLTGLTQKEATGVPLDSVFKIVNEETRRTTARTSLRLYVSHSSFSTRTSGSGGRTGVSTRPSSSRGAATATKDDDPIALEEPS
jgi:PAS domain S-box-containing protein